MKQIMIIAFFITLTSCQEIQDTTISEKQTTININKMLNQWHNDVAVYDYDAYFNKMTDNAFFVGTDATEVWSKQEFQSFSKPFFDKKQTWNFKPHKRNIYFNKSGKTAWFDETLDTWMGVCRGSGVVSKKDKDWKIEHYVLSVVIPNDDIEAVVSIKKERDSLYLHAR